MKYQASIDHGGLSITLEADDREDLETEILEIAGFINENQAKLGVFNSNHALDEGEADSPNERSTGDRDDHQAGSPFGSISTQTGVKQEILSSLFELPDDEDGVPSLSLYHFDEGTHILGNYRNQRQAQACTLLLYVWEECLNEKKVDYERLDRALIESDIETERRDAMGQAFSNEAKEWFESEDKQRVWLVGSGKNKARELIKELSENVNE